MIACDFDGTIVPPDMRPPLEMPKEFVKVIQKCHEIGISFAFITGRPTKQIIEAVKNAKAFANAEDEEKFIKNLTIYGRFGTHYREPNTRGEELIRSELEQYIPIRKKIDGSIQRHSLQDPILKEYIKEDSNNPGKWSKDSKIEVWENTPGMAISYEGVKKHLEKRIQQGEKINIEEELELVHTSLKNIISNILGGENHNRAFYENTPSKEHKKCRICIYLNPSTTGVSDTKIDPTISLTERLQAKGVIAIGDDLPDIDMQKALRQLIAVKKLIDHYKSDEETKQRLETLREKLTQISDEELEKSDPETKQRHAMFKEMLAQIPDKELEKRDELNKEFYSLLTNSLERQVFIGVQSPEGKSTPKEIKENADFLLNEPVETTRLLKAIVEKLKN
jgi:2-hydroxy-3-keto-5-methylthiopentenyl-1-phosphate phosphatase